MIVAILGGTGPFGRGLATRLVAEGVDVIIGSRDPDRAREIASVAGPLGGEPARVRSRDGPSSVGHAVAGGASL